MGSKTSSELKTVYSESIYYPISELISEGLRPKIKYQTPKNFHQTANRPIINQCRSDSSWSTIGSVCGWYRLEDEVKNYPACSVGYVESWFGGSLFSCGTGFLIHENIVMTCGHHLYNKQKKMLAKEVNFYPARTKDQGRKMRAVEVFCPNEYSEAMDPKTQFMWDFGLIVLKEHLHHTYGYLGLSFDDSDIGKKYQKKLYGYSGKNQDIEMYQFQGDCQLNEGIIKHSFMTDNGVDGGPILFETLNKTIVIGIHQGNYKQGRALKLRTEMFQQMKHWLSQTRGVLNLRSRWDSRYVKKMEKMNWKELYEVDLSTNSLDSSSLKVLMKMNWKTIIKLNISENNLGKGGLHQLVKGDLSNMIDLDISSNLLENEDLVCLNPTQWLLLQTLNIRNNKLTAPGIKHLVKPSWQLRTIDLSDNSIGKQGTRQLLQAKWKYLQNISLAHCNLESEGVYWLTKVNWKRLRHIDLSDNNIRDEGLQQLQDSNWIHLQSIVLDKNQIKDKSFKIIATMPWNFMKNILARYNFISSQSVIYLCQNHWKKIQTLDLSMHIKDLGWNKIEDGEKQILRKTFRIRFKKLYIIDL